jgi:hypothetical protein
MEDYWVRYSFKREIILTSSNDISLQITASVAEMQGSKNTTHIDAKSHS